MRIARLALISAWISACGGSSAPPAQPPAAPTGLAATGGKGQISLTWSAVAGATYTVLRGSAAGAETQHATASAATYTDTGLTAATTYFYVVQAVKGGLTSGNSNESSATTAPAGPTGLTATGGVGQVVLGWNAVAGATAYSVQRGAASGGPYSEVGTPSAAAFTDTTVAAGTTYYYVVDAVTPQGTTDNSSEASALTAPAAPTGLTAATTDTGATLQWTASPGAASYDVTRAPGGVVGNTATTSISDSGLTPNTSYTYSVKAKNASGVSTAATVPATTAPVAPTGLSATASNHHVTLSWTAAPGAGSAGYRVLHATSASGPFTSAGTATGTTFTDTFLTNNTQYFFTVHTLGGSGESGDSGQAHATPFIEICTVDASSYAVSVFDGTANGNVAPKRSFGWSTGIAEGTGIATDGTTVWIASKYTQTINAYPRATVTGDQAPSSTLSLPGQPTALAYDASVTELLVGIGNQVYVYDSSAAGTAAAKRTLTLPNGAGTNNGITGIQVFRGTMGGATPVNQMFVLADNKILVYGVGVSGTTAPVNTIAPNGISATTALVGPAYDNSTSDAVFIGWYDNLNSTAKVASYARTTDGAADPVAGPIAAGGANIYFGEQHAGGIVLDGTNIWVTVGGAGSDALIRFAHTGGSPAAGWTGSSTQLFKPGALTLDSGSGELWYVNGRNGAGSFLKTTANGNRAPAHSVLADSTGLYDPVSIAADRVSGEIVVLNQSPGHPISVYPISTTGGGQVPARQIVGPTTTLDTIQAAELAIDEAHREYWVRQVNADNGMTAFDGSSDGDAAPVREIGRDLSLGAPQSIFFEPASSQIFAIGLNNPVWNVSGWNRTDSGSPVAPDRSGTLTTNIVGSPMVDVANGQLVFKTDGHTLSAFPIGFSSGAMSAVQTFDTDAIITATHGTGVLAAVDGEGNEFYFTMTGSIIVTDRPANGGAVTIKRTLTGLSTGIGNPVGIKFCN